MVYKSPSKIFRDVMRITKFNEKKKKILPIQVLSATTLQQVSIPPEAPKTPNLSISEVILHSIPAAEKKLSIQKTIGIDIPSTIKPKTLSFTYPIIFSVPPILPEPSFHPYIVEASKMLYGKPPWELTSDQTEHFKGYQDYKFRSGLPIEEDLCYKPSESPA
jgi:hypothetical protein